MLYFDLESLIENYTFVDVQRMLLCRLSKKIICSFQYNISVVHSVIRSLLPISPLHCETRPTPRCRATERPQHCCSLPSLPAAAASHLFRPPHPIPKPRWVLVILASLKQNQTCQYNRSLVCMTVDTIFVNISKIYKI